MFQKIKYALSIACLVLFSALSFAKTDVPVLLVHGLSQNTNWWRPMIRAMKTAGFTHVVAMDYSPKFGQARIEKIAEQIDVAAHKVLSETGQSQIDIVSFSMGAVASRYVIQRRGGQEFTRKFISISGPQKGTYAALFQPIFPGVRDMAPKSPMLKSLEKDEKPFGNVQVYSFYTPYDFVVFPATNSIIDGSTVRAFNVALHHQMLKDKAVIRAVIEALKS
jgi:triacylglycerol esterase/lipase EstA (alpha/beta hydrolase family)